jgi:hypothetical protein
LILKTYMRRNKMSEDVTFKIFRGEPDEDGEPFGK